KTCPEAERTTAQKRAVFVFLDSRLYDLYAFHINAFVWNLLTTPGGIDSLGADQINISLVSGYILLLIAIHLISLFIAFKGKTIRISARYLLLVFFLASLAERAIYGLSHAELYAPVLNQADHFPLYQPMKMNSFLTALGFDVKRSSKIELQQNKRNIHYPKSPLKLEKTKKPFNIIMLLSESLRWDLLNPEVMPNMMKFAQRSWNFKQHYSGGNGTRQGLFALFYGIPGTYWDLFLRSRTAPVFFEVLNRYQYQYFIYTSARFSYPEFDQTIFSRIPAAQLIENNRGEPWKRDQKNTTAFIQRMQQKDPARPFYGFLFYEASHARYSFPDNAIVRRNYLPSLDYAGLSRKDLLPQIAGLKARYENAARSIDIQIQRIIEALEQSGDLQKTILIISGDHGEEFMERGRWGHNSAFTDWQTRVPMIVWMPDSRPRVITQRSSHLDVMATLLPRLGLKNPLQDYTIGIDLSSPQENRTIMVSSWTDMGLINDDGKLVIPFKSTTQHKNLATDLADHPIDAGDLIEKMKPAIIKALADARYYAK
ncbi:MAG: sulfatase-like hydrolase/transferase, partial [gamma proteobacterium symbiont of Bathyaustriella thionipta]|nr:sulfatase-like hydrolase/transferase [gamma proteobacterium symbiont of Bathyaustriella thionipta]